MENVDAKTRVSVLMLVMLCNCVGGLMRDVLHRVVSSRTLTPTAIGLEPTTSSCLLTALIAPVWPTIRETDPCA